MFNIQTSYPYRNPNYKDKIDGLVQERSNSIANAMELRLSCTNPSRWTHNHLIFTMWIPIPGKMVFTLKQGLNNWCHSYLLCLILILCGRVLCSLARFHTRRVMFSLPSILSSLRRLLRRFIVLCRVLLFVSFSFLIKAAKYFQIIDDITLIV